MCVDKAMVCHPLLKYSKRSGKRLHLQCDMEGCLAEVVLCEPNEIGETLYQIRVFTGKVAEVPLVGLFRFPGALQCRADPVALIYIQLRLNLLG